MSDILACRVCLATDNVKLYHLKTLNLMHSYEILTGLQIPLEDKLPQHICTFCSALLLKSLAFKEKCYNSQEILKFTAGQQGRLTLEAIRDINRPHCHPYTATHEHHTVTIDTTVVKQEIKEEEERVQKKSKRKKKIEKVVVKVEDEINHDHDYVNYDSDSELEPVLEIRALELQNIEIPEVQIQDGELKDVEIVILSKAEQKQEIEKRKTSSNYLNSYYKCEQCYKGFITEPTYRNHMTCHDPERGPHTCDVCSSHWACARALRAHALNTHERKYMCKVCDHVSRSSHRAKEHSKWHSGFSFICKTCGASFAKSTSYLTHTRLQHPSSNSCDLCGESFVGEFGLRMHKKKTHYSLGSAQCDRCDVRFDSREALVRHLRGAGDGGCDNTRPCAQCGEGFDSEESLREHADTHHGDDVRCEECQQSFSSARSCATHYQRVHLGLKLKQHKPRSYKKPADSHVCEMCGKKCITKATLMYHQRIHTGERPFHCTDCPKKFSVYQRLQIHQRIHTGETPYQCKSCPKAFKHKAALNRHDRVHTGAKPYSCPHCGKSFSQSNSMKLHVSTVHLKLPAPYRARRNKCDKIFASEKACLIHQRVHTNPRIKKEREIDKKKYYTLKNIVCEVCGKQYASNAALRYHQRVHTGERPYRCSMCPKSFTMPLFLQIHTRTHTGERPYECQHCPKAFSNKAALLRHDRVHTGIKPYECPQCGKFFTQSNSMKLHVRTVHLKLPAPYKSRSRRGRARHVAGLTVQEPVEGAPPGELSEVKLEREYEEIYQQSDVYQVYQSEENPYAEIKVESSEVAMYDNEEQLEVLYEEVYEVQEV